MIVDAIVKVPASGQLETFDIPLKEFTTIHKISLERAFFKIDSPKPAIRLLCQFFETPSSSRIMVDDGVISYGHFATLYSTPVNPQYIVASTDDSEFNTVTNSPQESNKLTITVSPPVTLTEDGFVSLRLE